MDESEHERAKSERKKIKKEKKKPLSIEERSEMVGSNTVTIFWWLET